MPGYFARNSYPARSCLERVVRIIIDYINEVWTDFMDVFLIQDFSNINKGVG